MTRLFDILFSFFGLLLLFPVLLVLGIIVFFDTGKPLFIQTRVGKDKKPFKLIKLRTMNVKTKSVATHLVNSSSVTKYGAFLRKSKLDELPQLFNVLLGDMSLVGPRPNLFNQKELVKEREKRGVYNVLPGITGEAQVRKIDMSTPELLAKTDAKMIQNLNFQKYIYYIVFTVLGKGYGDRIKK